MSKQRSSEYGSSVTFINAFQHYGAVPYIPHTVGPLSAQVSLPTPGPPSLQGYFLSQVLFLTKAIFLPQVTYIPKVISVIKVTPLYKIVQNLKFANVYNLHQVTY